MIEQLQILAQQVVTLEFWQGLLEGFQVLGPMVPILLAALESFIPALPLVAIVTLNVAAHGAVLGFVYSWLGTCLGCTIVFLFYRKLLKRPLLGLMDRSPKVTKAKNWVNRFDINALFLLAIMPFTPSSFLNLAFGLSDFGEKNYLYTMYRAKLIMILLLALAGQSVAKAFENPVFIVLAVVLLAGLYWVSKKVGKQHDLDGM
ncbi:MAG: TVP38/TMEM64 family protein [Faecalibacterium sp.]|nr:TVP38/TMEM64 family protein [Faecalibacterium sp.]